MRGGTSEHPWSSGPTFVGRRFACTNSDLDMFPRALFPTFAVLLQRDPELWGKHTYYRGGFVIRPSGSTFANLELLVQPSTGGIARDLDEAKRLWSHVEERGRRYYHEGPLRKLSEHTKQWNQRYLRIRGPELRNFTDESHDWEDDRNRRFDLDKSKVSFDKDRALCFRVKTACGDSWLLEARTERERRACARAIKECGRDVTIENAPEDVDVEELDSPAIDLRVRGPAYADDCTVYERCEQLLDRSLALLRDAQRRVCAKGTSEVTIGALSLGDQDRFKTQVDLPALTAAFDLAAFDLIPSRWSDQISPQEDVGTSARWRGNSTIDWREESELRIEIIKGKGCCRVWQDRRRAEAIEAERFRRMKDEAAAQQREFARLRQDVLEAHGHTLDELRTGCVSGVMPPTSRGMSTPFVSYTHRPPYSSVAHIINKLDASMQLSFELEQKGVPSRLQLLPHDIDSGDNVCERFAARLKRSVRATGLKESFRLLVLCEGDLESECCRYKGAEGVVVSFPGATLRRALPLLKLTSGLMYAASLAGTVVGLKLPPGLPWLSELEGGREKLKELMAPINNLLDTELRERNEREASGQDKCVGGRIFGQCQAEGHG